MRVSHVKNILALALVGSAILGGVVLAKTAKTSELKVAKTEVIAEDKDGAKKEKGLRFSVLGDWGWNGKRNQTEVARIMANKGVGSFIISAGDNFQIAGVRSVQDPLWMLNFENVFSDPELECTWCVALGNHDYKGNVQAEIDYSKISSRWNMPARYYAVHKKINAS